MGALVTSERDVIPGGAHYSPDSGLVLPSLGELAAIAREAWPTYTADALVEGPIAVLLETMHIEGNDYTFQQLRDFTEKAAGVGQEGAVGANDYKVVQRGAGANMSVDVGSGDAWVKMDTGVRNGLYLQGNDATVNVPIGAAHATLPRLDQIVLQVNDSNVVGATNIPELKVLAGTATSGADLDNRNGAAALGNDRIRLADVLVPAAAASIVTANIRGRRPWARGAFWSSGTLAGGGDYTSTSTTLVDIDAVNLKPRLELSGSVLRITFTSSFKHGTAGGNSFIGPTLSPGPGGGYVNRAASGASEQDGLSLEFDFSPAAGSYLVPMQWLTTAGTMTIPKNTSAVCMIVEESVQPSVQNA